MHACGHNNVSKDTEPRPWSPSNLRCSYCIAAVDPSRHLSSEGGTYLLCTGALSTSPSTFRPGITGDSTEPGPRAGGRPLLVHPTFETVDASLVCPYLVDHEYLLTSPPVVLDEHRLVCLSMDAPGRCGHVRADLRKKWCHGISTYWYQLHSGSSIGDWLIGIQRVVVTGAAAGGGWLVQPFIRFRL